MSTKMRNTRPSETNIQDITWEDVFKKTTNIPDSLKQRMIKKDKSSFGLHGFIQHSSLMIETVQGCFPDHFSKIETAVDEVLGDRRSKRIAIEANLSSPSDYGKKIHDDEIVSSHRFSSELHVGLQVEAFGFNSEEVIEPKYCEVASTLMQEMSGVFPDETSRVRKFQSTVGKLGQMFTMHPLDVGRYKSDGAVVVQSISISNWEFKNEFSGVVSCPVTQNHAYFMWMKKGRLDRSPMLLVSVIGCHYFQVFGAVWNGQRCVCVDPLGSPASLLFVPRDPHNGVLKLARLLSMIDKISQGLIEYYNKPEGERHKNPRGPYWTNDGHLEYDRKLEEVDWLFEATRDGFEKVVVKFIRGRYGEAVHEHLASLNFAPKLLTCRLLPGGWYAVVMEKLKTSFCSRVSSSDKAKRSLKKAVKKMHKSNYVHGDLREQNVMVMDDETVRIVDFDWADTEGTATYPPEINTSHLYNWHPGVKPAEKIKKEHDTYLVDLICK